VALVLTVAGSRAPGEPSVRPLAHRVSLSLQRAIANSAGINALRRGGREYDRKVRAKSFPHLLPRCILVDNGGLDGMECGRTRGTRVLLWLHIGNPTIYGTVLREAWSLCQ
jgi:hypothetical protein